jgi:hypothetical protein
MTNKELFEKMDKLMVNLTKKEENALDKVFFKGAVKLTNVKEFN